ncbi:MAG: serine hydrolase [bacterium]|nr:serine hydrolase [bacterium]
MNIIANLLLMGLSLLNSLFLSNQFIYQLQDKLSNQLLTYQKPIAHENIGQLKDYHYSPYPTNNNPNANFNFKAIAGLAYDLDSDVILAKKNENQRLPIASLTKIVTSLVILKEHKLDEIVTIPEGIKVGDDDQKLGIKPGQKFKLSELLRASLIYSANDAALALAIWDSGTVEKFATKMNSFAGSWGLNNSHFTNPAGFDDKDHYSTASDLVILVKILLNNKQLSGMVDTPQYTITSQEGKPYPIINTNRLLLSYNYIHGIKTGFTLAAGQSVIVLSKKNDRSIVTIILNSPDRFGETKQLIDFTINNYTWK